MKFYIFFSIIMIFSNLYLSSAEDGDGEETIDLKTEIKEDNSVLVLNGANFDQAISENDIILVEFYAPWCGHCKSLAPEYETAAAQLKESEPKVALAKVDATVETELAQRYSVNGYPTLKWFKSGDIHDYDGPRKADGIVEYMKEKSDPNYTPPPSAAIKLTSENFDETVNNADLMLVEFFAPWCGHCKQLAPEYEAAAKRLAASDPPITLATVDATVESSLASKYEVTGYPTLKVFRKGKASEYKGGRDEHGIVDYMESQRGDGAKLINTSKDLKKFMNPDDVTVIGFFEKKDGSLYENFMDVANENRENYKFGVTFDESSRSEYKVKPGTVVVFKPEKLQTKFETKSESFDQADGTSEDIFEFIKEKSIPLVGHYTYETREKRYKDRYPLVLFFYTVDFSFEHRTATQLWRNKIAKIANDYRGITFAIADEDENNDMLKSIGLEDSGEEMNVGIFDDKGRRYPMPEMEEFDSDDIREFLDKFKKGAISPHIKSQPVPKKQGVVKTVVGKNFDSVVRDNTKDVLIELYAPWCGHCKKLEPIYKNLAKKYKTINNLVIAKIDATANDVPEDFKAEGFPTIYFSPADKKTPIKYSGERDVKSLSEFIESNASVSLSSIKDEL